MDLLTQRAAWSRGPSPKTQSRAGMKPVHHRQVLPDAPPHPVFSAFKYSNTNIYMQKNSKVKRGTASLLSLQKQLPS